MNEPMLDGQVALVTGASRGIGRAIAIALAARGARVVGTATTAAGAAAIDEAMAPGGGKGMVLDVRDAASCDACIEVILKGFGSLDVLVNNAGITRDNLMMRMKDDEWDDVIATNLSAVFRMTRGVLRTMVKARRGRIISITSVVEQVGNAGQANYAAAKAGVSGMTRALAREVGSRGITVNCVAPGFIRTDMTSGLTEAQIAALTTQIPLNRFGLPEDIAHAVCFLASPAGSYITGSTLDVNGGAFMS